MTRTTALRIFGLDETASDAMVWAAYSALRSHLESRLRAADAMNRAGALSFYREQLRELDAARELVTGLPSTRVSAAEIASTSRSGAPNAARSRTDRRRSISRTVVLLVGLSSLAWGLGSIWTREAGLDSAHGDPPGAGSAPAPARLGLHGNLPGAVATVIETSSGEMRWQGPADGRLLTLPQGDYSLVVEHPQCPDSWNEQIHLEPGQRVDRFAQNCRQHGLLAVRANVDEARISIDGRDVEAADGAETVLPTGPHRIRVERTGYEPWETSVDLAAASRVSLQANLAPSTPPPAKESPAVASAAPDRKTDRPEIRPPSSDVERRTHEWQRTATEYLLARYDRNQSGDLDSLSEIESIPCSDWRGLEQSFDAGGLALSMTRFYGFDGSKWVDNAFGVTNEMRGGANLRLKDCGLR